MAILPDQTKPTADQLELIRLRAENAALISQRDRAGTFKMKVSEKGAMSIYGMGRFPATFYDQQWRKLLARKDEILAFLDANKASLKQDKLAKQAADY